MPTFVTFSLGKEELAQFETQKFQKKIQLIDQEWIHLLVDDQISMEICIP